MNKYNSIDYILQEGDNFGKQGKIDYEIQTILFSTFMPISMKTESTGKSMTEN